MSHQAVLKTLVGSQLSNPILSKRRAIIDEFFLMTPKGIAEIPYGSKRPFSRFSGLIHIFKEEAGAMITLAIFHHFLHQIVLSRLIDIHDAHEMVRRSLINGRIEFVDLSRNVIALGSREQLWSMKRNHHLLPIAFAERDIALRAVVINLYQPATRDRVGIADIIRLLDDVYALIINTNGFRKEIESPIAPIEHQFDRHDSGRPEQIQPLADHVSGNVLHVSEGVIGSRHKRPIFALMHATQFLPHFEFDAIGFLIESRPSPVASTLDLHAERLIGRTKRIVFCSVERVEIPIGANICFFRINGCAVVGIDIQHG